VTFDLQEDGGGMTFDITGQIRFTVEEEATVTYNGTGRGEFTLPEGSIVTVTLNWPEEGGTTSFTVSDSEVSYSASESKVWITEFFVDGVQLLPSNPVAVQFSASASNPSTSLVITNTFSSGTGYFKVNDETVKEWNSSGYDDHILIRGIHRIDFSFSHSGGGSGVLRVSGCASYIEFNDTSWGSSG